MIDRNFLLLLSLFLGLSFKSVAMYGDVEGNFSQKMRPTPFRIAQEIELRNSASNLSHLRRPHPPPPLCCHSYSLDPPPFYHRSSCFEPPISVVSNSSFNPQPIYEELLPVSLRTSEVNLPSVVPQKESQFKKYVKKVAPILITAGIVSAFYWGLKSYLEKDVNALLPVTPLSLPTTLENAHTPTLYPFAQEPY